MDSSSKNAGSVTPAKEKIAKSKLNENMRHSENVNPNVSSPGLKFSSSPLINKSEKSAKKSASKNANPNHVVALASPSAKKKIRERKFVVAKRRLRNEELNSSDAAAVVCEKCKKVIGKSKCLCVAYENLRASQEEFFKNRGEIEDVDFDKLKDLDEASEKEGAKPEVGKGFEGKTEGNDSFSEANGENNGDMSLKRSRDKLFESGSGKVMHLVKEFEKLSVQKLGDSGEKVVEEVKDDKNGVKGAFPGIHLVKESEKVSVQKLGDPEEKVLEEVKDDEKGVTGALPGLQQPTRLSETQLSSSSFCPSDFFLTSECLGLDSRRSYSLDSSQGSFSVSAINSEGGRRMRRSSTESTGNRTRRHRKKKQPKATSQKPFMLRTEERGKCKEEEFMKKLQQMLEEEEKKRIPIAQGLPWTTDEPECLVRPPVKESTKPIDLVLHSDIRAAERSDFDTQVAIKMHLIEQYRTEREKLQKLAEEEEIRRLRKELIPKAQPMPYFDRPFIPRRSMKHPTMPKEPKFQMPQHKKIKCYLSLDDLYAH